MSPVPVTMLTNGLQGILNKEFASPKNILFSRRSTFSLTNPYLIKTGETKKAETVIIMNNNTSLTIYYSFPRNKLNLARLAGY